MALFVGDYGQNIDITMLDEERKARDLSATDVQQHVYQDPAGNQSTQTAVFTDGTGNNGVLRFVLTDGFLDAAGTWKVRAQAEQTGVTEFKTEWHEFEVHE